MGYCSKLAIQTPSFAFADSQGSGKVLLFKKKKDFRYALIGDC